MLHPLIVPLLQPTRFAGLTVGPKLVFEAPSLKDFPTLSRSATLLRIFRPGLEGFAHEEAPAAAVGGSHAAVRGHPIIQPRGEGKPAPHRTGTNLCRA